MKQSELIGLICVGTTILALFGLAFNAIDDQNRNRELSTLDGTLIKPIIGDPETSQSLAELRKMLPGLTESQLSQRETSVEQGARLRRHGYDIEMWAKGAEKGFLEKIAELREKEARKALNTADAANTADEAVRARREAQKAREKAEAAFQRGDLDVQLSIADGDTWGRHQVTVTGGDLTNFRENVAAVNTGYEME